MDAVNPTLQKLANAFVDDNDLAALMVLESAGTGFRCGLIGRNLPGCQFALFAVQAALKLQEQCEGCVHCIALLTMLQEIFAPED